MKAARAMQLEFELAVKEFVEKEVINSVPLGGLPSGRAHAEEMAGREWLRRLGFDSAAKMLEVIWNPRLSSSAGICFARQYLIYLNPRLVRVSREEVERTLLHELAHLIARLRNGRRRIRSHGREWKQACADLGIAGEARCHELPLPKRTVRTRFFYKCPGCGVEVARVRRFKRREACTTCCRKFNGGAYDERFRFVICAGPVG